MATVPDDPDDVIAESGLIERSCRDNPFFVYAAAPHVLGPLQIESLRLARRTLNGLKNARIITVADAMSLGFDSLCDVRNLGPVSVRDLAHALEEEIERGPVTTEATVSTVEVATDGEVVSPKGGRISDYVRAVETGTLWEQLDRQLASLKPRDAEVLRRRLGFTSNPETLEVIGESLGVSRERARQIEVRAWNLVGTGGVWLPTLRGKLKHLLTGRCEPLYADMLPVEDGWFDGFEGRAGLLESVILSFCSDELQVWPLQGRVIVTGLERSEWAALRESTIAALEAEVVTGLTRREVDILTEAIAVGSGAAELASVLKESLQKLTHFSTDETGASRLVSVGRGIRHSVMAVLSESPRPLTLNQICAELRIRGVPDLTAMYVRNVVRDSDGVILGRGLYGTLEHLKLSPDEITDAGQALREIIFAEPERQWHAAELADALVSHLPEFEERADVYLVKAILDRVPEKIRYLGRFVWSADSKLGAAPEERRELSELIEEVLVRAGRALSKTELRSAVSEARGLGSHFLPTPKGRVFRLGRGYWGLIDRDSRLSDHERRDAMEWLRKFLDGRKRALHVSELLAVFPESSFVHQQDVDSEELLGLAQVDPRFRVTRGNFISLCDWRETGRLRSTEAWRVIKAEWPGPQTTVAIAQRLSGLLERTIPPSFVSNALTQMGFLFDQRSQRWENSVETEDEADDDL